MNIGHYKTMIRILIIFGFLSCILPANALAQTPNRNELENITKQQKQAEMEAKKLAEQQKKTKRELAKLQAKLVRESSKARNLEKLANQTEQSLKNMNEQKQALISRIREDRAQISSLLAALIKIDKNPPPALAISPQNSLQAAKSANMMAWMSINLQKKTEKLKAELFALQEISDKIHKSQTEYEKRIARLDTQLKQIKSLIKTKSNLSAKLDKDRKQKIKQARELAKRAKNLEDLIEKFERNAKELQPDIKPYPQIPTPRLKPKRGSNPVSVFIPQTGLRFADTRGQLALPVLGRLKQNYGEKTKDGSISKGIIIATKNKAQITAPFGGRVEFAGPFNDDIVIILNVGDGYFIVLTGLGQSFVKAGAKIKTGEPLGQMPEYGKSQLFMEFRKNRTSVNPAPWIAHALR